MGRKKQGEAKTEAIRVNVTPELRRQLDGLAEHEDRSIAYLIREAITEYLQRKGRKR